MKMLSSLVIESRVLTVKASDTNRELKQYMHNYKLYSMQISVNVIINLISKSHELVNNYDR